MADPVIARLTDFGTGGHCVAAMKGAIQSVCRNVTLVEVVWR